MTTIHARMTRLTCEHANNRLLRATMHTRRNPVEYIYDIARRAYDEDVEVFATRTHVEVEHDGRCVARYAVRHNVEVEVNVRA